MNLKTETGKQLLKELVRWADVVVENFSPRVLPSLGLDYPMLEQVNPRVVLTSVSNFGQTGPYRDRKADEITLWASGGLMRQGGLPDYPPLKFGPPVIQYSGGLSAFTATMMPYYARPMKLTKTPHIHRHYAPLFGEHNGSIYGEILGMSHEEIAELERKQVIGYVPAALAAAEG